MNYCSLFGVFFYRHFYIISSNTCNLPMVAIIPSKQVRIGGNEKDWNSNADVWVLNPVPILHYITVWMRREQRGRIQRQFGGSWPDWEFRLMKGNGLDRAEARLDTDLVAYEGVMSDSAGVFRRGLEIEFRGSDTLCWRLSPGLWVYSALRPQAVSYVFPGCVNHLDPPVTDGEATELQKREKEEDRMLVAHSRPTCFGLHLPFGVGGGCLGFHATRLYFSWAALATGLTGRSHIWNPTSLILPEVCYLSGFKAYQKDLGVPVETPGEVESKQW